jgi:hypothetical protein
MSKSNSTAKAKETINERIRLCVRERLQPRTISLEVSAEFALLCARYQTTPENVFAGFMDDATFDWKNHCDDSYKALFYQTASKYLSVAHGSVRIIQDGKYTERPAKRTFN